MPAPTIQRQILTDAVRTYERLSRKYLLGLAGQADRAGDRETAHRARLAIVLLEDGDVKQPDHAEVLRVLLFSLNNLGGYADGEALNAVQRAAERAKAAL